jgi:hypothetical protein
MKKIFLSSIILAAVANAQCILGVNCLTKSQTKEELKNSSSAKLKTDDEKRKIRQKLFDDLEREAKRNKKSYDFFNQYNKF